MNSRNQNLEEIINETVGIAFRNSSRLKLILPCSVFIRQLRGGCYVHIVYILSVPNTPRSIYQYSNMTPRLSGKNCNFLSLFCLSIPKRDLDSKKTTPNKEVCPESLGARLEY